MKRIAAIFLIIFIVILNLVSCADSPPESCRSVLLAMTKSEIALPAGRYYFSKAEEGSDEYLPDTLIVSLLGNGSMPPVSEGWLDCALFLSLNKHPCEFAVILCRDSDTAKDTAKLLTLRLDVLRHEKKNDQYADLLDNATVTVIENYAIMTVSTDSKNAIREAKKLIFK